MNKRIGFMVVMLAVFFSVGASASQMIESAEPIPSGIGAEDLKDLTEQKNRLDGEFEQIQSDIQEYNAFCSGNMSSMNTSSCQGRYYALTGRMSTYQASLGRYRSAIQKTAIVQRGNE